MEVENATEACADQELENAFLSAKAKVAKVSESAVTVQCVVGGDSNSVSRRLTSRRLAEAITMTYTITVESEAQASEIADTLDKTPPAQLANEVKASLPENSPFKTTLKVTGITATVTVVTVTTTTTQPPEEEFFDDSHAHTPAALGAVAMAMVAATLTLSH